MNRQERAPRWIRRLLSAAMPPGPRTDALLGDLEELYAGRARRRGRLAADLWYARQAVGAACRSRIAALRAGPGPARHATAALRALVLATRRLGRAPGFTGAVVSTLAIGLTTTTVVFAVYHGVVLAPLPYPDPERLVVIEHPLPGLATEGDTPVLGGSLGQLLHYRERSRELRAIGAHWTFDAPVMGTDTPRYVRVGGASGGFFRALGLRPVIGRLFQGGEPDPAVPGDGDLGQTVLGHGLWTRMYGADPDVLDSVVRTQGYDYVVIGVAPAPMPFPPERVALWNPISDRRIRDNPTWTVSRMVGRMAPGATPESVAAELDGLIAELPRRFDQPQFRRAVHDLGMRARVTPLRSWLLGDAARALGWLLAASGVVLLIAAVNATSLLTVRARASREEVAVRRALGAGRSHAVGHFLAEGVVLLSLAGVLATGLSEAALAFVVAAAPPDVPRIESVHLGPEALALLAATVLAGLIPFGLIAGTALGGVRPSSLAGGGPTLRGAGGRIPGRRILVALQIAMAATLLAGAGLVMRSAVSLAAVEPGFEAGNVLTFRVPFPFQEIQAADPGTVATPFYDRLAGRLSSLPGVEAAGYGGCVPLSPACAPGGASLRRADLPTPDGELPMVEMVRASPGFLEALGVPLLEGRRFAPSDHQERTRAVLVSASMAARFWPEGTAVGGRLVQDGRPEWGTLEVVGVVGDVRFRDLAETPPPLVYVPVLGPATPRDMTPSFWAVRSSGPPVALSDVVRAQVTALRPDVPVASMAPLQELVAASTASLRLAMWLLVAAAAAAILLCAVGVYGVVAYAASQRLGELGVRMALGARAGDIRGLLLSDGVVATGCGLVIGLGGSLLVGGLVDSLLYGVSGHDPITHATVALGLGATALLAALLPARRAARLDPATILRREP